MCWSCHSTRLGSFHISVVPKRRSVSQVVLLFRSAVSPVPGHVP
jgi:hypothetical protein